jgi:hypothetical protein
MTRLILALFILFNMDAAVEAAMLDKPIDTNYEVKAGDTLDSITQNFITEERSFLEFREGIIEMNYDNIFESRIESGKCYVVYPGDILKIHHRKVL